METGFVESVVAWILETDPRSPPVGTVVVVDLDLHLIMYYMYGTCSYGGTNLPDAD